VSRIVFGAGRAALGHLLQRLLVERSFGTTATRHGDGTQRCRAPTVALPSGQMYPLGPAWQAVVRGG
jgi:hypothetical protein